MAEVEQDYLGNSVDKANGGNQSKPILWHILKIYSFYGINDFIICCGYKGYLIEKNILLVIFL